MTKYIIHVNRQHIAMNANDRGNRPVYTIKSKGGRVRYAREVHIKGPSKMVYDGSQLNCGARAWIETDSELELVDEMSFQEARQSPNKKSKCIMMSNGSELWMYNKKLHREDGPAVFVARTNTYKYYLNGDEKDFITWLAEAGKYHLTSAQVTMLLLKGAAGTNE